MSLLEYARQTASAQVAIQVQEYGPWLGSMSSLPAHLVPPEYIADSDQMGARVAADCPITAATTINTPNVTSAALFGNVRARMAVTGTNIPAGTTVLSVTSSSAIVISQNATATSATSLTFTYDGTSQDYLYLPRSGSWKRRGGTNCKFDTTYGAAAVGLLPAKWGAKVRDFQEYASDAITDGIPSLIALLTKETMASASVLDDGRFSTVWLRDQVNGSNYTLGSEFSATLNYQVPGTVQSYKVVPLWYDSGDGGITRGPSEFTRRFFVSGSRKMQKVGNWWYFPSLNGTPSRWNGTSANAGLATQYGRPTSVTQNTAWTDQDDAAGDAAILAAIDDTSVDDANYVKHARNTGTLGVRFSTVTDPGVDTGHILRIRAKVSVNDANVNDHLIVNLKQGSTFIIETNSNLPGSYNFGGSVWEPNTRWTNSSAELGTSFVTYEYALTTEEAALITDYSALDLTMAYYTGYDAVTTVSVSWVEFEVGSASSLANRLIPSGPLPPTHAGVLSKGDQIENTATFLRPVTPDISAGTWIKSTGGGTDLYTMIDDPTRDDSDFIRSDNTTSADTCEVSLGDPGFVPSTDDIVYVTVTSKISAAFATLTVNLVEGTTIRSGRVVTPLNTIFSAFTWQLTADEINNISDWTNLRLRFTKSAGGSACIVYVSQAEVQHISSEENKLGGGWRGYDKFYYSVAYRFEDDSIWMPCTPRGPNDEIGTAGYNLFQVDAGNPTAGYEYVQWTYIPIGPYGTKSRLLLRSEKIDARTDSTLQLNPGELHLVHEIPDNTTTTYKDYYADDESLTLDPDRLLIRDDHSMPPRSRYLFAGDSRVCHSYGGLNPCAIELAPVGYAAAYDLNVADTSTTAYADKMYFQVLATGLKLYRDDASADTQTLLFATYNTLEKLVDKINATVVTDDGGQWRAQICPGANPQADPATCLTLTTRAIASCTIAAQAITAVSGLSVVPVGSWITSSGGGAGSSAGAYVSAIVSDTELTFVGTLTAGSPLTITFTANTGDAITGGDVYDGYQRAIANSLPGFLYFNKTYLDQFPVEKATIWNTVASPGSVKSAPNCFSLKTSNRHTPPLEAGISMGGFAVDNGFVVPFSNKSAAIRNTRDTGTGFDSDYRLFIVNDARGCCAWGSVAAGPRCGVFASPEGIVACDLFEEKLCSRARWRAPDSDSLSGLGDFGYELPLSSAATAMDVDYVIGATQKGSYLTCSIHRGRLWVNYRTSASTSHANRQLVYAFSDGDESNGLRTMFRPDGSEWGWSAPLTRSVAMMCEGRRDDGAHLYGWRNDNAGSTGDGRVDELEVGETDNNVAISTAVITTPWLQRQPDFISAQAIILEHSTPTGATAKMDFHRTFTDELQEMTPTALTTFGVTRDRKELQLQYRAPANGCYIGCRQSAGTAQEIRRIRLLYKVVPIKKPAA